MGEKFIKIDGQMHRAWPIDKDEVLKEMTERLASLDDEIVKLQTLKTRVLAAISDLRSK